MQEKYKGEILNKKTTIKEIIIILILFVSIAGVILPRQMKGLDEIWNYNFARCISNNMLPYKDFSIVQTPLLPIICGLILKVVGNELITMRILAVLLMTAVFYLIYKIFTILKIDKLVIRISLLAIFSLLHDYFCIDYNFAVILITLLIIYFELKELDNAKTKPYKEVLLGILAGTSMLFKQTTGLALTLVFIFYKILLATNKENFKKTFKVIGLRILGVAIPIAIFAVYLKINNIENEFLNYTVYSLKTFSNKVSYLALVNNTDFTISMLSITVPLLILFMYYEAIIKKQTKGYQKKIFILFAYSVSAFTVVYPISDEIHFLIGSIPSLVAFTYVLSLLIERQKENKIIYAIKSFLTAFSILTIAVWVEISITNICVYISTCGQYNNYKHFKYIPECGINIKKVDDFIEEKNREGRNVYILDSTAAIYMIPIDKYNKDYDMFLKGNIGAEGEEGQIEKLKQEEKSTIVLIKSEEFRRNWQNPEEVRKYIIDSWKKTGKILTFDIYEKEN